MHRPRGSIYDWPIHKLCLSETYGGEAFAEPCSVACYLTHRIHTLLGLLVLMFMYIVCMIDTTHYL